MFTNVNANDETTSMVVKTVKKERGAQGFLKYYKTVVVRKCQQFKLTIILDIDSKLKNYESINFLSSRQINNFLSHK